MAGVNKEREIPVRIVYRNKRAHGAHHGGAWKVAFADFMTAMFALFLVLWLINQSSDVKSAIAGYFQDPLGRADEFGSSIMKGDGAQAATVRPMPQPDPTDLRRDRLAVVEQQLEQRMNDVPELKDVKAYVEMEMTSDGLRINLLENATGVFFETGDATPSERGQRVLSLIGVELAHLPNNVRVEGYTDARPYARGGAYTNWELSADRANAARRILNASGVTELRVAQIRGMADRELRDPAHPNADSNRRVTITVLFDSPSPRPASADSAATGPVAAGPAAGATP